MQHTITTIYCLCDDFLQAVNYTDDPQARVSSAEVMSVSLVGACSFGGKVERAQQTQQLEQALPRAQRNCVQAAVQAALAQAPEQVAVLIQKLLFKENNPDNAYTVDSMPISACDNPPKGHPASSVEPGAIIYGDRAYTDYAEEYRSKRRVR